MNAWDEIQEFLWDDEEIEAVVIGDYQDYSEEPLIENFKDIKGKILTQEEAKPYLFGWYINQGFGAINVFGLVIWTNLRVIFISEYDGATSLCSMYRNPTEHLPGVV